MKIANAALSMQSQHVAATRHEEHETLRAWIGRERPDFEGRRPPMPPPPPPSVKLSEAGMAAQSAEAHAIESAADAVDNDPFLALIRSVVEMLTGRAVRVFNASEFQCGVEPVEVPDPKQADAAPSPAGFGIEYEYHAIHEEIEQTDFSAEGVIRTADGREIAFKLDLSMARQFREETNIGLFAGDAKRKDPLVINFDGTAAQLSDHRFRFDLDADGRAEDVPLLGSGSGYLVLDVNGNGKIDSGAELFGPRSGAGFAELAGYDQDGNGWIDESDAVFDRLLVWSPVEKGAGTLSSLKDHDIGALFLNSIGTPFELRGTGNSDLGAVRASSLYLTEAGGNGTLQEIDLTA